MSHEDYVLKRCGRKEITSFDKILKRVKLLGGPTIEVNYTALVQKVIDRLYNGIPTSQIDELTAQQCASLITTHPDYGELASRILVSNHHKNTPQTFREAVNILYGFTDINGEHSPLLAKSLHTLVEKHGGAIESMIDYDRDYLHDYFGFKTLERAYMIRANGKIIERPQHMWMRVSLAIHGEDLDRVKETYDRMSQKYFTHATPTLFNAGTPRPQLSSCYLLAMEDDSIDGIYGTLTDCAKISKWAGGIGLHIHNIRAAGSHIRGTNGNSNGIVPMLRVFNNTARYVDQGGGKRNGSFAIYLEPWHADIRDFLDMKKNHGDEEARARDLFYALWIPDLFMERVKAGSTWTLMCPDRCPGLSDVYGDEFKQLYEGYEDKDMGIVTVKARDIWFKILDSQIETGTPYMLYKDACNKKSNQKNLGTIKSSNLCTEIIEYSAPDQTAVCNLASIGLPLFVKFSLGEGDIVVYTKSGCKYCQRAKKFMAERKMFYTEVNMDDDVTRSQFYEKLNAAEGRHEDLIKTVPQIFIGERRIGGFGDLREATTASFDYKDLHTVTKIVTENLNNIIDINFYPTPKTKKSNMLHRPIGIGVQGLADTIAMMDMVFISEEARALNRNIFETIYHAAVEKSCELAIRDGPYSSFEGCPASLGKLQFDLWGVDPGNRYDWNELKQRVVDNGLRNSLLLAPMPTASTSQILGNNECFEPFTSNIYVRRTIAGEFVLVNKHLLKELVSLGLWTEEVKNSIIANGGSVQQLTDLPENIRKKYEIVWEMSMKDILNLAADRGAFICQSQSTNLWMKDPDYNKLTAMHFHAHQIGLKTGIYYLRTKAKAAPQQFTIAPTAGGKVEQEEDTCDMCSG